MAIQLQLRKGTKVQNDAFTGAEGELTYDSTTKGLRIHDGSTQGGIEIPTANTADFVVESQLPTAENNYTWYRKYKSGWVEQGGNVNGDTSQTATFPVEMADTHYTVAYGNMSGTYEQVKTFSKTTTNITIKNANGGGTVSTDWQVSGMASE